MNKQIINVWGRKFELEIVFDCYAGEQVLSNQVDALNCFLEKVTLIDECKPRVIEYCLKKNGNEIGTNHIENIFKYVIPKSLYIQRTSSDLHVVGLMCAYKFDTDNGIAIIFKNEEFSTVGTQNIIL